MPVKKIYICNKCEGEFNEKEVKHVMIHIQSAPFVGKMLEQQTRILDDYFCGMCWSKINDFLG